MWPRFHAARHHHRVDVLTSTNVWHHARCALLKVPIPTVAADPFTPEVAPSKQQNNLSHHVIFQNTVIEVIESKERLSRTRGGSINWDPRNGL